MTLTMGTEFKILAFPNSRCPQPRPFRVPKLRGSLEYSQLPFLGRLKFFQLPSRKGLKDSDTPYLGTPPVSRIGHTSKEWWGAPSMNNSKRRQYRVE